MPDIVAIGSVLGSIKAATDIAKLIKDSDLSLEQAEVKLKIADLIMALANAKMEFADIRELLIEKEKYIRTLKKQLKSEENIVWEKPYYFVITSGVKDGPFCQSCYDSDSKLIRLQDKKNGRWDCHQCKAIVRDSTYKTMPSRRIVKS